MALTICSLQYWYEQNQPQRKHFISRHMSFHGNTVTALSLSGHFSGREPYEEILQHENVHMVSPAFAKRFQRFNETEETICGEAPPGTGGQVPRARTRHCHRV
jgi:adenosylmethionine-8-amino-7-oxononanoate aminotransferase